MKTPLPLFSCIIMMTFISCSPVDEYPLNTPQHGFAALQWGMSPDSAHARMMEMPGITVGADTTVTTMGGYYPAFAVKDSVEISMPPVEEQVLRYKMYGEGTFLGSPVYMWTLTFANGERLVNVGVKLYPDENNNRRQEVLKQEFGKRYTIMAEEPWGSMGSHQKYQAHGISGTSDTTQPADTYAELVDTGSDKTLRIGYDDKAAIDRMRENPDMRTRVMVGMKEWKRLEKEWEKGSRE